MMDENEMFDQEPDIVEFTTDDGETIQLEVVDYFFYNGQEYVILAEYDEDAEEGEELDPLQVDCFVMKVVAGEENGEEIETFEPIEDEELENRLLEVATARLEGDDEDDEE